MMSFRQSRRILSPWLCTLVAGCLLSLSSTLPSSGLSYEKYDEHFEEYGERYLPEYDWKWFKAQGYQESRFDRKAVSSAGARGVMQIMPGTWREETRRLGIVASPNNARVNILVGINYMKRMVRFWKAPRTDLERLELAQASYNAGAGHILRAQGLCNQERVWKNISPCLVKVTGKSSEETVTYVKRIKRWYNGLIR